VELSGVNDEDFFNVEVDDEELFLDDVADERAFELLKSAFDDVIEIGSDADDNDEFGRLLLLI
jgi:hypothetical protein